MIDSVTVSLCYHVVMCLTPSHIHKMVIYLHPLSSFHSTTKLPYLSTESKDLEITCTLVILKGYFKKLHITQLWGLVILCFNLQANEKAAILYFRQD